VLILLLFWLAMEEVTSSDRNVVPNGNNALFMMKLGVLGHHVSETSNMAATAFWQSLMLLGQLSCCKSQYQS